MLYLLQHITFNEYLPMLLGKRNLHRHGEKMMQNPAAALYAPVHRYWSVARAGQASFSDLTHSNGTLGVTVRCFSVSLTTTILIQLKQLTQLTQHRHMTESTNDVCTGLVLYDDGYFDGYDPTVNPGAG